MRLFLLAALALLPACAQVCAAGDISGPYGFQLSGATTISGASTPMAAIGRLVFDGSGHIAGSASVNFNGLFLGSPVTGTYEFQTDCSLAWSLQDDSGGWQHFRGTAQPGGGRVDFHQTDPGAGGHGLMLRASGDCTAAAFHGPYAFSMSGVSTPLGAGAAGKTMSEKTVTVADGNGNLSWKSGGEADTGTYEVDSDCFVRLNFEAALRGILVDGGRTVLAVQTDPEQVAVSTFKAQ